MNAPNESEASGRDKLLDAAGRLFRAAAYREVSVAELTKASGVQAPTLYYHFKDKEGLFVAWAERVLQGLGSAIVAGIEGRTSPRDQLAGIGKAILACDDLDLTVLLRDAKMLARGESQERIIQAYLAAVFEPLGGVLVRGIERGKLRPEPVPRMANAFVLGAISMSRAFAMETLEPEDAASWWAKQFVAGFGT